jgi:hypothetical protein
MADLLARDVLDYDDRLKMAALRILAESRKPVDVRGPGEIRIPVGAPPDNWLYNTLADPKLNAGLAQLGHNLVGSGTGRISGDILAGFLGGGAGIATEAAGGESGALDWIPGGGLLKAGVIASPKVVRALTNIGQRIAADDAVEITRMVAQDVVDRLAHSGTRVTADDVNRAVSQSVDELGEFAGAIQVKRKAAELANGVLENANAAMRAGQPFSLTVKSPDIIAGLNSKTLEAAIDAAAENARQSRLYRERAKNAFDSFSDDVRADILRKANEAADLAVAEAERTGNLRGNKSLAELRRTVMYMTKNSIAGKMLSEMERSAKGTTGLANAVSTISSDASAEQRIKDLGADAYAAAKREALASGMSAEEATVVAQNARSRATYNAVKEIGGAAAEARAAHAKATAANTRNVFHLFSPEIQADIERLANEAREARRAEVLSLGGTGTEAKTKARDAYTTMKNKETRRILKELGFKNANDPRLADYERIGRNDTEHILKSGAGLSMAATPETVYGRALEEEAQELARQSGEDYSFVYDILMGRNNGDEDAMALYDMLMGK